MKNNFNFKSLSKRLFKLFGNQIFFLFYGKIKIDKRHEKKTVKKSYVKFDSDVNYFIHESNNSRIYTNRIQDTAVISNNVLLKAQSFQLRNNNFSKNYKKNIVFKIGTPRRLHKLNGTLLSLLTGGGGNNNFFHWMFDVLPKLAIVEKHYNLKNINYYLCPDLNKWQLQSLNLIGIKKEQCLSSVKYRHVKVDKIITVSHPWLRSKHIVKDIENLPLWISKWLKSKYLKNKSNKKKFKKIYIDRSDVVSNARKIINENKLKKLLKKNGFLFIKLANLNFQDEIKLFNQAKIIIGLQGAGLTNLVWCNKKTKIIELRSKFANKLYENLAKQNRLNYHKIVSKPLEKNITSHSVSGTLKVDLKKIQKLL